MKNIKNEKNCLNCKYEPDWSEPSNGEYKIRTGQCKWIKYNNFPNLPSVYKINRNVIQRFSDDSGIYYNCKTWESKIKIKRRK